VPNTASQSTGALPKSLPSGEVLARRRRRRYAKDRMVRWLIRSGGGAVVVALALIFVYLFSEVMPILRGASLDDPQTYAIPGDAESSERMLLERYGDLGVRFSRDGKAVFWKLDDRSVLRSEAVAPADRITPAIRAAVADHQDSLLAMLPEPEPVNSGDPPDDDGVEMSAEAFYGELSQLTAT